MIELFEQYNAKRILIIGGAGFIGSNLVNYFQENYKDIDITVFDLFNNSEKWESGNSKSFGTYKNLLNFRGKIICGDINSIEDFSMLLNNKFDFIFHLAAISDTTVHNENLVLRTNLNTFEKIIQLTQINSASLVYASSGAVYGNTPSPQTLGIEAPANIYGYSKLMMDRIVQQLIQKETNQQTIVGLRFFNVYGKNEFYKDKTASMILQFGLQILKNKEATLFQDSEKIYRDFVYVEDVIQALVKAGVASKSGIYNVGSGFARSFQDIVNILSKELEIKTKSVYIPNPHRKNYQFYTLANIENTKSDLSYEPKYTLEQGIGDYIKVIKSIFENLNL